MMYRLSYSVIVLLFIMTACNATITPEPTATVFMTDTASVEEMTQGAGLRMTLPPSFTPTFTPSVSPTSTATHTPTATATATFIPEAMLCEEFIVDPTITEDGAVSLDDLENTLIIYLPYFDAIVSIEISNLDTGEVIDTGTVTGYFPVTLSLAPDIYPEVGHYEWLMTIEKDGRPGMCERRGTFDTREDELPGYEPTAEITAEITAGATVEVTAEMTAGATLESTALPGIMITLPATAVEERTATPESVEPGIPFPPR